MSDKGSILQWATDADSAVTAISDSRAVAAGEGSDPMVGLHIADALPASADRALLEQAQARALGGEAVSLRLSLGPEEFDVFISPRLDESGAVVGTTGAAVAVAGRTRLNDDAGRIGEPFRRGAGNDLAGIFVSSGDGAIRNCNRTFVEIFGFDSASAAVGTKVSELYREAGDYDRLLERLRLGRGVEQVEINALSNTGRSLTLLGNFLGRFDEEGELQRLSGSVFDITERKVFEEQLIQSQRLEAVGQLAGGIAHDFNNLLTAVLGYVYLAQERLEAVHSGSRELTEIRKAAERAASLTHQLLTFARRQAARPQVLDLRQILSEVEGLIRSAVGEHTDVAILGDHGSWRVRVDPLQIEQVLVNLAVNAHDSMPRGGRLTIALAEVEVDATFARQHPDTRLAPGPYVCLAVTDTGSGMSAKVRRHVFEPFYTTKEIGEGSGLGLATVYGIVKQNGGFVSVYSEPGMGTTFKLYLPRAEGEVEYEPEQISVGARLRGSETILVVEDEPAVREITRQSLMRFGYRVFEAESGEAALEIFDRVGDQIDLLLLDVVMPGMSGADVAEELVERRPSVKVLFMSGWPREAKVLRPSLASLGSLLEKPFTTQMLLEQVRRALESERP